jgi:hypothetical protein
LSTKTRSQAQKIAKSATKRVFEFIKINEGAKFYKHFKRFRFEFSIIHNPTKSWCKREPRIKNMSERIFGRGDPVKLPNLRPTYKNTFMKLNNDKA